MYVFDMPPDGSLHLTKTNETAETNVQIEKKNIRQTLFDKLFLRAHKQEFHTKHETGFLSSSDFSVCYTHFFGRLKQANCNRIEVQKSGPSFTSSQQNFWLIDTRKNNPMVLF